MTVDLRRTVVDQVGYESSEIMHNLTVIYEQSGPRFVDNTVTDARCDYARFGPLLITKIHPGSLAHAHSVLREGAKLLAITVDGVVHRNPEVKQAARLISEAVGEIRITIQPLLDRYGFVVDVQDYTAGMATRGHVRVENEELRKWQKRVGSIAAWKKYAGGSNVLECSFCPKTRSGHKSPLPTHRTHAPRHETISRLSSRPQPPI